MKILITASRGYTDKEIFYKVMKQYEDQDVTIINGSCKNTFDIVAQQWSKEFGKECITVLPDYITTPNKSACLKRNIEMVNMCDVVYGFWDESSKGTKFTIDEAVKWDKSVFIFSLRENTFIPISAEKQKVKDSLNNYKSKLREETYPKLTKTINKDKVRELEIRIETLNKLL
jgi:hypothetical protein